MTAPTAEGSPLNEWDVQGEERLYQSLDRFWHPVLYATDLTDTPQRVVLLETLVVVVRLGGEVRAFADRCAHRGTAVSLGWVEGECLRCPYHGWLYNADGQCIEYPARDDVAVSPAARLERFHAAEENGLIYVCLAEEPRFPIPVFPEFSDPAYRIVPIPEYDWEVGPARRTENFVDFSHFAWVHDGVLANRDQPLVPDHVVTREDGELRTQIVVEEPAGTEKTVTIEGVDSAAVNIPGARNYRIPMPFTVWLQQEVPGDERFVLFMACMPLGPKRCRSFTFNARTFAHDEPDETYIKFQQKVVEQDRPIAESQRPEELPVDLREEMYVRGADQVSVEYRRWLLELVQESEEIRDND